MSAEAEIISTTPDPQTRSAMARRLRENSLAEGTTVLVHASLSSLGWVAGGPVAVPETEGSPIIENGVRQWKVYQVPSLIDSEHFIPIGKLMGDAGLIKTFTLGSASCAMFSARAAVDFAVKIWRQAAPPGNPPIGQQRSEPARP